MYPAKLATWIGNDFSHYYIKNDDLTLQDMKNYIETILGYIKMKIQYFL